MIPINTPPTGCDAVSSNCVIWQGPDLPCVDICNGDSISSVIAALCDQLVILQDCCGPGGGVVFDITNIDQSTLEGGPATTLEELIQLIINNILISGGGDFDCGDVQKCIFDVPECFVELNAYPSLNNTLEVILTDLMECCCFSNTMSEGLQGQIDVTNQKIAELKAIPKGEPNPKLYSSGVVSSDGLIDEVIITKALDKAVVDQRNATGIAAALYTAVASQPSVQVPLSAAVFGIPLIVNPKNIADSVHNLWAVMADARDAIKDIQDTCCAQTTYLVRMNSTTVFYAEGNTCAAANINAVAGPTCTDIWNTTGVQFDPTVPAYNSPYAIPGTELTNGTWWSQCPGSVENAEYSTTAPHWVNITVPPC